MSTPQATAQTVRSLSITTDSGGNFPVGGSSANTISGFGIVHAIAYVPGTILTGATLTITDTTTGVTIFSKGSMGTSNVVFQMRRALVDTAGAAISGAYDAPVCFGSLTVTITGGGANKTGTLYVMTDR